MKTTIVDKRVTQKVHIIPCKEKESLTELLSSYFGIKRDLNFKGKYKEILQWYHPTEDTSVYILGVGKEKDLNKQHLCYRSLAYRYCDRWEKGACLHAEKLNADELFQAVLGLQMATYQLGFGKTENNDRKSSFFQPDFLLEIKTNLDQAQDIIKRATITAEVQQATMRLVDEPPNVKNPEFMAQWAIQSAKKYGYKVKVWREKELKTMGMHALLSVGRGSDSPPLMIRMEYKSAKKGKRPLIGLVGKGITFDTGGISIKNATNMHYMKSDMGGAAAVMGAVELAARLELPVHVVGIAACAENAVDARSYRPGDVISSYSGKTIEVIDTDAEGRLALADALSYMVRVEKPTKLIDLATLTGSCVQALGYHAAGLFCTNEILIKDLVEAGQRTYQRLWALPMFEDYEDALPSDIADIKNLSGKPVAGAIHAAKFLEVFTENHPAWAHLDIAGMAFGDSDFAKTKSATGFGVRLLVDWMSANLD